MSGLLATHPPISERLRRIYGRNIDLLDAPKLQEEPDASNDLPDIPYVAASFSGDAAVTPLDGAQVMAGASTVPVPASGIAFGASGAEQVALAPQLLNAVHEPFAACAVVYALLLGHGAERDAQITVLDTDAPQQRALALYLADAVAQMPKSARLPLLDIAMPALRQLAQPARDRMLATVDRLIAADKRVILTEFVLRTVLARRLDPHAGRAVPVKFGSLSPLKHDCSVLLSLVAQVAASGGRQCPAQAYASATAMYPELNLDADGMLSGAELGFAQVQMALDRMSRLAPLAKPLLIKLLLAATSKQAPLTVDAADLLRAICAAIEVPVPAAVAATYTAHAWSIEDAAAA